MPAFQHAQPRFLKKIFGALPVCGQVQQIAEQPELVLLDQPVEQIGVALFERACQGLGVVEHEGGEAYRARQWRGSRRQPARPQYWEEGDHVIGYTRQGWTKTQGAPRPIWEPTSGNSG